MEERRMTENLASNGTPMDELTEQDWEDRYPLGKFDTVAAEKIHSWTLDSNQDDECGNSTDWHWWAAKFDGSADNIALGAGVIVEEMSSGSTSAVRYETKEEYDKVWSGMQEQYEEYRHAECAKGRECEGCFSCENA
jgi:hypothetical protein